jgi:hypothetical protein
VVSNHGEANNRSFQIIAQTFDTLAQHAPFFRRETVPFLGCLLFYGSRFFWRIFSRPFSL